MTDSTENPMLNAHMVGAEKNDSPEDASTGGEGRVEGWISFLVRIIALPHARFRSATIIPPLQKVPF